MLLRSTYQKYIIFSNRSRNLFWLVGQPRKWYEINRKKEKEPPPAENRQSAENVRVRTASDSDNDLVSGSIERGLHQGMATRQGDLFGRSRLAQQPFWRSTWSIVWSGSARWCTCQFSVEFRILGVVVDARDWVCWTPPVRFVRN